MLNTYKDAAGIWHEDRFRPLLTALANLGMNLVMVQFWGIYGVLLSTVLSTLIIGMPWLLHNLFTVLFDKKQIPSYIKCLCLYSCITIIGCALSYLICSFIHLDGWAELIVRGIICCIIPNVLFLLVYHRMTEFKQCVQLVDKMTKGKISILKKLG